MFFKSSAKHSSRFTNVDKITVPTWRLVNDMSGIQLSTFVFRMNQFVSHGVVWITGSGNVVLIKDSGDSFRDPFHIGLRECDHALVIGTEDKYKYDKRSIKKAIEIRKRRGKTMNRDEGQYQLNDNELAILNVAASPDVKGLHHYTLSLNFLYKLK